MTTKHRNERPATRRRKGGRGTQRYNGAYNAAAQAVEHYEIARCGTLIAWAKQLGRNDCASALTQNLSEERATDKKLTELAEVGVNRAAA